MGKVEVNEFDTVEEVLETYIPNYAPSDFVSEPDAQERTVSQEIAHLNHDLLRRVRESSSIKKRSRSSKS